MFSDMYFCFMNQTLFQSLPENITNSQHNSKKTGPNVWVCNTILIKLVYLVGVSDFVFVICSDEN